MRSVLGTMLMVATFGPQVYAGGAHGDILVGRTSGGQLVAGGDEFSFDEPVHLMPGEGLLMGFVGDDPGFDAEEVVDDPGNDLFALESGAMISIEAIALDAAFKAWGPGLGTLIDEPGEAIQLGGDNLHEHLTWHADAGDPDFDSSATSWSATFRLIDTGSTGYAASVPFTLQFVGAPTVPAVSGWGLLIIALVLCAVFTLVFRDRSPAMTCGPGSNE